MSQFVDNIYRVLNVETTYRKIAFTTRSRLQPALDCNPHFSRNSFSKARLEPSLKIVKKITTSG